MKAPIILVSHTGVESWQGGRLWLTYNQLSAKADRGFKPLTLFLKFNNLYIKKRTIINDEMFFVEGVFYSDAYRIKLLGIL